VLSELYVPHIERIQFISQSGAIPTVTHFARPETSSERRRSAESRRSVHGLFEDQARRTPNSVAIRCGDETLTYSQLDARANQLAWHLRNLGVESGTLVGVCVPRSIEMAIAILGILKAGGAWLPLDQRYPSDRQSLVLEDAGVSVLVTEQSIARTLPRHAATTVLLDRDSMSIASRDASDLPNPTEAGNLAYIMYTSGSMGRPKGVMITHANVCHYVNAMHERLAITERDVYLHTASMAFSSSVRQLILPLTSGARVVVAKPEQMQEPLSLFSMIRDQQVTVLDFIPSYWRICIDALARTDSTRRSEMLANKVRLIATASEPLLPDLPRRWRALGHGAQLINMFGLTETTGIVTTYTIPADCDSETATVPIGYPLGGTRVHLFDEFQNEVPVGSVGELFVAGPSVGLGYLNQPEQTAERFVSDPLRAPVDGCLFRTGDMARFGADGSLEFLGRVDDQIKISGVRIELAEVEAALRAHPAIEEVAVIARGDDPSDRRAVAYVAPAPGATLAVDGMRTFLRARLPEPMIPSGFVIIESLPRLPNGKLDRDALPVPTKARPELSRSVVPPRTATERRLVEIWEAVLAIVGIGITDNFFDLGGNSLAGLYMLARVHEVFGKHLPATAVLQAQTIEEMAKLVEEDPVSRSALIPLQAYGSKPPFFWIHGELSNASLPRYLGPDQPLYALVHQSQDGNPARFTTVEEIAGHYLEEVRTIQPSGPYLIGGFCFGALVAFEIAHQLRAQGEKIRLLVLMEPSPLRNRSSSPVSRRAAVTGRPSWQRRIRNSGLRHLQNLRQIHRRDRLHYVWVRTVERLSALINGITSPPARALKRAVCWAYHSVGVPVPYSFRSSYILGVYRRATQRYAVRTYPGSVSLFVPRDAPENSISYWKGLATGTIEIHEIPDGHEAILKEPLVQVWAETLKACLNTAQAPDSFPGVTFVGAPARDDGRVKV
jgi:amino acid adenylation domain-containing protein